MEAINYKLIYKFKQKDPHAGNFAEYFENFTTYNFDGHFYTLNGVKLLSPSTILAPYTADKYKNIPPNVLSIAAQEGNNIHEIIQLLYTNENEPKWSNYTDKEKSAGIEAANKLAEFLDQQKENFKIVGSEIALLDPTAGTYGFADLIFTSPESALIVEIKTRSTTPATDKTLTLEKLQLATYCDILKGYNNIKKVKGLLYMVNKKDLQKSRLFLYDPMPSLYSEIMSEMISNTRTSEAIKNKLQELGA